MDWRRQILAKALPVVCTVHVDVGLQFYEVDIVWLQKISILFLSWVIGNSEGKGVSKR